MAEKMKSNVLSNTRFLYPYSYFEQMILYIGNGMNVNGSDYYHAIYFSTREKSRLNFLFEANMGKFVG